MNVRARLRETGRGTALKGTRLSVFFIPLAITVPQILSCVAEVRQPRQVFRDCPECPEMVVVPAGSYMMGSPEEEAGRDDDEGPRHRVTITYPLAVGVYEVTFAEWDACVDAGGCGHRPNDEGWGRGSRPVINVSLEGAREYAAWLARRTGERYRLLSEAEWEWAARGGTTTARYWGEGESAQCGHANGSDMAYEDEYPDRAGAGIAECRDGYAQTAPVGTFVANAYGLHDVLGNVSEWTEDCISGYEGVPTDGSPERSGYCDGGGWGIGWGIARGGSWAGGSEELRSAYRENTLGDYHVDAPTYIGFRVARAVNPVPGWVAGEEAEEALELDVEDRVLVQRGLLELGHDTGLYNGILEEGTRAALRAWQKERDLEPTGYLTAEAVEVLQAVVDSAEAAPRRRTFRDCPECPEMVVVPAGSYMMGLPEEEEGRDDDEGLRHRVTIGYSLAVGVYEVTFTEWDACVAAGECGGYRPEGEFSGCCGGPGSPFDSDPRNPVVKVSWDDARRYVDWLSAETGAAYRLLSEAEWEYVARAGTETAWYWGEAEGARCLYENGYNEGNYAGIPAPNTVCFDGFSDIAPVGSFLPNPWGLYDMLGNAPEWTEDCWHDSYEGAPGDGERVVVS